MLDLATIAQALNGEVRGGQVLCPGPGHRAADRSLSVKLNGGGDIIVHSFAGDDPIFCKDFVRKKLGLPAFKPNGRRQRASHDEIAALMAATIAQQKQEAPSARIVALYDYKDADRTLLYQVLRLEPKSFRQRRPNGNGGWTWKLDERRVLYRWPELLEFPDATVFITEGEKDADRVAQLNLCATTVAYGKWTNECVAALAGRDVVILQDNDEAGRKKALETAAALHGTARTIRVVELPDLPNRGDVSDWLDAAPARDAVALAEACFAQPEWTPDSAEALPDREKHNPGEDSTRAPALPFLNLAAWQDQSVPERQWIVKDRIPTRNVTLLSGDGSIGKSILSLQLAAATVLGRDWLGALPETGPAVVVCCEDDANELWRRLDLIFRHYGAAYTEFRNLHIMALAGEETLMARPDRTGLIKTTDLFKRIRAAACDIKPKLIVLDNSADIFGGNENDRAQVRQFIGLLRSMAMAAGAGVLLTSHPSLTGINTGTGLSGSTAWNASVRSRLYFRRATTEQDEEPDPDLRVLEMMKSNYGPVGETITLRWSKGLFLPVSGTSNLEKLAAEQVAEHMFLKLIGRFERQGRTASDKPTSHNYAPSIFAKDPEAKAAHVTKVMFANAMQRLFAADKIQVGTYGRPSRQSSKLVVRGSSL